MGKRSKFVALSFLCLSAAALAGCSGGGGGGGHKFEEHPAVAATCTTPGNKLYYTCNEEACKDKIFDENKNETTVEAITIAALGHDYDYEHKTVTWTAEGAHAEAKCTRCDAKDEETVSEEPNFYYVKDSDATCTEKEKGHWHAKFKNTKFGEADSEQVEVGPEPEGHDYGDLVPEVVRWRDTDGVAAHYYCSKCDEYFDVNKIEVDYEDLLDPSTKKEFAEGKHFTYDFDDPIPANETIVFDINIERSTSKWIKFALYDGTKSDQWDNYTEYVTLINGKIEESNMTGVEIYDLEEDGYSRIVLHPSEMPVHQGTVEYISFFYINGNNSNCSGEIEYNPVKGTAYRGTKFAPDTQTATRKFTPVESGGVLTLDVKLVVTEQLTNDEPVARINTYNEWTELADIYLFSDGTLRRGKTPTAELGKPGIVVEKVDDVNGFVKGYYRLRFDLNTLNYINNKNLSSINQFAVESATNVPVYIEAQPDESAFHSDPLLKLGTGDTRLYLLRSLVFRESSQIVTDKGGAFTVKGDGTGTIKLSIMGGDTWKNCGYFEMSFTDSVLTECKLTFPQKSDKTCTIVDNLDGTYEIKFKFTDMQGDGLDDSSCIGWLYNGSGPVTGLTAGYINMASFRMISLE